MIRAALEGDKGSFDALVERYDAGLRAFLGRRLAMPELDDVVQETWLAAWTALPSFDRRSRFKTWLYALSLNKCRDHHRARRRVGPAEALLDFARKQKLARLSLDDGYGAQTLWEPEPVTVTLSGVRVGLPPGAFQQATADGEERLLADARAFLAETTVVADLFAGLGTFAFALAGPARVLAVEAARAAHLACKAGASATGAPVHALHRDLFRNPLLPEELDRFDAVLLDPPRAGARDQVAAIAASKMRRVAYVSCNPSSWARDARVLVDAGFRLEKLRPVGQFRWSTHVELTSLFLR